MKLTINGETREFFAENDGNKTALLALLGKLGFGEIPVLVEHNGTAIRAKEHADIIVEDGDQLEIIRIVAGG
jgi:thiamine biosynthesis protein ThiS